MEKAGYGPDKRLKIKVSTRNIAVYRDPAVILIDQLKEIYIDGELDVVETSNWFAKVARKDYRPSPQPHRQRGRRSRPVLLRELRLQLGAQLHPVIATRSSRRCSTSSRWRPMSRSAASSSGHRQASAGGRRPADIYHIRARHLLASPRSRASP